MARRNAESGAALVVALLALAFMSIVGLVLLNVVREGLVLAAGSEAKVQAEFLAQNGIDEAAARIRKIVDDVHASRLAYRDMIRLASLRLQDIRLLDGTQFPAARGHYRVEIVEDREISNPEQPSNVQPILDPDIPYVRKFVVRSVGTVDRRPAVSVAKEMTVYVSTIHPVFRYPVSARGDLVLNGTPTVVGDVLVRDGRLSVSNEALFIGTPGSLYGLPTDFPALQGFLRVDGRPGSGDRFDKTTVLAPGVKTTSSGDVFEIGYFSSRSFPFEDPTLGSDGDLDPAAYVSRKAAEFANRLSRPFDRYETVESFEWWVGQDTDLYAGSIRYADMMVRIEGARLRIAPVNTGQAADVVIHEGSLKMHESSGGRRPEMILEDGSLYIRLTAPQQIAADLAGTLSVRPDRYVYVEGDVVMNDGFEFPAGSMYIRGNLTVVGDIRLQGTVYVDGDVDFKEMRSVNKKISSDPIPLILAATGNIVMGDNTNEKDNNTEVRAFLFSKRQLKMYGVLSHLILMGGIHGENASGAAVELNAVRGDLLSQGGELPYRYAGPAWLGPQFEPDQEALAPERSRLQIYHDADLYEKPPTGIPVTEELNVFVQRVMVRR